MAQANEALREADRRKDDFVTMLAHELRNPLAPVRNALQMLKMPGLSRDVSRQTCEMMDRQVLHLVRLVDDLLDINRITHDRLELRQSELELSSVIQQAIEVARPLIDSVGHDLVVNLPDEAIYLRADPARLAQEVALFADRTDVTEEITRLGSHVGQVRALLGSGEPAGRKLDFLVQEMHREVNTIGSKSQSAEIAAAVVEMKAEVERMREQVQNVE